MVDEDTHECKVHFGETAFMDDLSAMAVVDDWGKLVPLVADRGCRQEQTLEEEGLA